MSRIPNAKSNTPPHIFDSHHHREIVELVRFLSPTFELHECHFQPYWSLLKPFRTVILHEALVTFIIYKCSTVSPVALLASLGGASFRKGRRWRGASLEQRVHQRHATVSDSRPILRQGHVFEPRIRTQQIMRCEKFGLLF